jgi:Uma2 family endonuclease
VSAALEHPIGPTTIDDWLAQDFPPDGSRLELIFGYIHVSPSPSGRHQYAGDELRAVLKSALREAGVHDMYPVTAVGIEISSGFRTALIPDVAVLNTKPISTSFPAESLVLAVEVWSPGNSRSERDTKMAAYASAAVPFFWAVNQDRATQSVTAYRLRHGRYVEELTAKPGAKVTIAAAPVPVTFDPADLFPS